MKLPIFLLILFALSSPWIAVTFVMRQQLRFLRQQLGISMCGFSMWFYRDGIPVVLKPTLFSKYLRNISGMQRGGGIQALRQKPLISVLIPIKGSLFNQKPWSIEKKGTIPLVQKTIAFLQGPDSQELTLHGSKYQVWAFDPARRDHIISHMDALAPKLDTFLSDNITWGRVGTSVEPTFYGWSFHIGCLAALQGLPEDISSNPDQFLSIVDGFIEFLRTIGEAPLKK
ncbi:hypothetical protein HY213_00060 [Candidatus Peregrinibacteria bacterium]|nr:hypothetical protein [Candidatus Peregrinibacteria bacterium]